jgi:hypothetical protein
MNKHIRKPLFFRIRAYLFTALLALYFGSCVNNKAGEKDLVSNKALDSIVEYTLYKYASIPKNLDSLIPYSEYGEILENVNFLEEHTKDDYQKQILKVAKYKCNLLSNRLDLSLKNLMTIKDSEEYFGLKNFYLGSYYHITKDSLASRSHLKKVYDYIQNQGIDDSNCYHLAIISKLLNQNLKPNCDSSWLNSKVKELLADKTEEEVLLEEVFKKLEL